MAIRVAHACFEKYHRARLAFVTEVADMASKPHYLEALLDEGAIVSLKKLLHDSVPSVQQTAALALGRLANYSTELAEELVDTGVLREVTDSMGHAGPYHQRAGAFVLRAVGRHTVELARACADAGALEVLIRCLSSPDTGVREGAAKTLAQLVSHEPALASRAVECGLLAPLLLCIREPEGGLKRAAAAVLGEVAAHTAELADAVADAGGAGDLVPLLTHADAPVRRAGAGALAQLAKHTPSLASLVAEAGAIPALLAGLQDASAGVAAACAVAVRELAKSGEGVSRLLSRGRAVGHLVDFLGSRRGASRLPAVMALGFLASPTETLAMDVLRGSGGEAVISTMLQEPEDHVKAAACWALGRMGAHAEEHANALAEADAPRHLLAIMLHEESSDDLQAKARGALRSILAHTTHLPALRPLLPVAPPPVQRAILSRFLVVLPDDQAARSSLVSNGALKDLLALDRTDPGVADLLQDIQDLYPAEVVEFCTPGFSAKLAKKYA